MAVSPYRVTPARIGNSSGLRLPAAFYRDHPQFAGVAGQVEVLDDTTLLLRLEPEDQPQGEADEDSLMLGLFLDFLSRQALTADIAHELRTPLSVQRAHLEALLDGLYPLTREHIQPILEQNLLLTRLVNDLRTLALADAATQPDALHRYRDLYERRCGLQKQIQLKKV
jgi:signal transduction histidine kinase